MNNFKSGFVSIIGRPNAGKSTLLNHLLKAKVAIVSPKAQTTRNKINGIYTTNDVQIVFVDTPGIHNSKTHLGDEMNKMAFSKFEGMDAVIWIVDVSKKIDELDKEIGLKLSKLKCNVILVLNKVDLITDNSKLESTIEEYKTLCSYRSGITISAENDFNLDKLIDIIKENLPYGPMYYNEDEYTTCPIKFIASEIIREKILLLTKDEVPHSVAVEIDKFIEPRPNKNLTEIYANIVVERPSQKKIIVGKNGEMIKKIGTLARADILKYLDSKLYLELFVKVEDDWRNIDHYLKEYGLKNIKED